MALVDHLDHLVVTCIDAEKTTRFYTEVMGRLRSLGLETRIWTMPVEIENAIPFDRDSEHSSYDPEYANRFWRILLQADRVFTLQSFFKPWFFYGMVIFI